MNELFYELIRVAIGTQDDLSHIPKLEEWIALYDIAKKQSLIGVCFAALQRLGADADEGFARIGMSEMLYLTWMGMAAKIQQKNQAVDEQCVALQKRLSADGMRSCILKGQGVGQIYDEHLRGLRQSGDIDVLMWKEGLSEKENRKAVIAYAQNVDKDAKASEHHIAVGLFSGTEVEMHYAPAYFCNPFANKRFKKLSEESKVRVERLIVRDGEFNVPSTEFNLVFLLAHMFRHYMSEGVGLRQLMDYYFVLREFKTKTTIKNPEAAAYSGKKHEKQNLLLDTLKSLNMLKFASAVMYIMKEVFGMSEQFLICEPSERLGKKLLAHVILGGNFGHHNMETVVSKKSHMGRFVNQVAQDLKLAFDYPAEALWAPISMIREFIRIRI